MRHFFGPEAEDWFDGVTLEVNNFIIYDPISMKVVNKFGKMNSVDDDERILENMHYKLTGMSSAMIRKAQSKGKSLEEIIADNQDDSTIDSDRSLDSLERKEHLNESDNEMNDQEYTFDLTKMINFEPPLGVGPHKDKFDVKSNRTNASVYTAASKYVVDLTGNKMPSVNQTRVSNNNE